MDIGFHYDQVINIESFLLSTEEKDKAIDKLPENI